ncbi:MAG TPA: YfiR family protein [Verrucomicrobiae bacterium]|nr:YfiR family protein [Verrucomicrobiae bacterium]
MRHSAALFIGAMLGWSFIGATAFGQENRPTEYQIKAAFLFNFAKFVEWPPAALGSDTAPMIIGVLGDNPFHNDLERTIQNKAVGGHPLLVKYLRAPDEAVRCQILFISSSEKARLPQILQAVKGASVLTVSEMDHFTTSGGMINLVLQADKIHFQINNTAATDVRLKISSKLLALAVPSD